MKTPLEIVVTNDDGITAPWIALLAETASEFGNVTVIAPDRNWSATGHQKALGRSMRVDPAAPVGGAPAYACDHSPSDCSALAGLGFLNKKIDVVFSGVNPTNNVSRDITYSGTVTAALEATIWGMRAAAFSLDEPGSYTENRDIVKPYLRRAIRTFSGIALPPFTILNFNFPDPETLKRGQSEFVITVQGERVYRDELIRRVDPFGRPYYWFGGDKPEGDTHPGTDCGEIARGNISVTPLHLDLTAREELAALRKVVWN